MDAHKPLDLAQNKPCSEMPAEGLQGKRANVLLDHDGVMCRYLGFNVPLQYINEKCALMRACRTSAAPKLHMLCCYLQ